MSLMQADIRNLNNRAYTYIVIRWTIKETRRNA